MSSTASSRWRARIAGEIFTNEDYGFYTGDWSHFDEVQVDFLESGREFTTIFGKAHFEEETGGVITYSFPKWPRMNYFRDLYSKGATLRNSVYGGDIDLDELYELLCRDFNGGEYFIDRYFDTEFEHRPCYQRYKDVIGWVKDALTLERLETGNYGRDARGRFISKALASDAAAKSRLDAVGREIREDIIDMLSTGQLPLRMHSVKPSTAKQRREMGLDPDPTHVFHASGQLIRSLNLYVSLDRAEV